MLDINKLITTAMKEKNAVELQVLRAIKAEFTKFTTASKDNKLNDIEESKIILKMKKQREDSIQEFKRGGREDLVEKERQELVVINKYAPKEVTEDQIEASVEAFVEYAKSQHAGDLNMSHMKDVMKYVKTELPTADGAIISKIFKKYI